MEDTEKYLIHAEVTAAGIVERSDVVGAIFGQTEGLLGDELDLPELRRTGKVGRIDVTVRSAGGESTGDVTIASSLDKVETATLAAALETIDRVGPCRATFEVAEIEDVRAAKRREVVERATDLLQTGFQDSVMSSSEILDAVRERVRVADVTEYAGLPAGPRVADGDAIIVVEGRADVLTLLSYGIKNAVAVEGTDVPDAIAMLTTKRTTTAFLDADRGGSLILEELRQVGDVDYVARPPEGRSVEELDHHHVFNALRNKTPIDSVVSADAVDGESEPASTESGAGDRSTIAATDGSATPAPTSRLADAVSTDDPTPDDAGSNDESPSAVDSVAADEPLPSAESVAPSTVDDAAVREGATSRDEPTARTGARAGSAAGNTEAGSSGESTREPITPTSPADGASDDGSVEPDQSSTDREATDAVSTASSVYDHVEEIVGDDTDRVRILDEAGDSIAERPADEAVPTLDDLEDAPAVVVLDAICTQQVLDVAAATGVSTIVADSLGQFVKRPASVSVLAADEVADEPA
ncbi:DNA primase DnaG [Halovivax limisalsi]|uniref:DNA primase DnaG n=1 Tax=Halovivax limisalsi TaxID=1453760 RepID=UPI001FFD2B81|nr:DNA primase DnaG [Halovivax limisalsi]